MLVEIIVRLIGSNKRALLAIISPACALEKASLPQLRRLAFEDLDAAMRMGLEMTMEHLRNQGQPMGRASKEALEDLK